MSRLFVAPACDSFGHGEPVVFAYNGKLAVEYLRRGLTSFSKLEHHHRATNTDAVDYRQARQHLLWLSRDDCRCVRACTLHSDSRFYTTTTGMHEDSGEQKNGSLLFYTPTLTLHTRTCTRPRVSRTVRTHVHARARTLGPSSFAVAKGKSGSANAGDETRG